jgi:hypothetical protein
MRAKEFIPEGKKVTGLRGGGRGQPHDSFSSAHPNLIEPAGRGDMYIGRYYDFYRVASLVGMDPRALDQMEDISFFGNLPVFSAYTEKERENLVRVLKKLKMDPKDWIPRGSTERTDTNSTSPVKAFKGYQR